MKILGFKVDPDLMDKLKNQKIEDKYSCANYILKISEYVIGKTPICVDSESNLDICDIILFKERKVSRLFVKVTDSIHSFSFPFDLAIDRENKINLSYLSRKVLRMYFEVIIESSELYKKGLEISEVFSVAQLYKFVKEYFVLRDSFGYNEKKLILKIVEDMYTYEIAYFRFDYDMKYESNLKHPLNHIDLFFSNRAKIKIGTLSRHNVRDLIFFANNSEERYMSFPPTRAMRVVYKLSRASVLSIKD